MNVPWTKWIFFGLGGLLIAGLGPLNCWVNAQENSSRDKLAAVIVDGQNNHGNWPKTSEMMKFFLEETGRFEVDVARTKPNGVDEMFTPQFDEYDVVISNYNGAPWPEATRKAFVEYMRNGGGFVVVHAADNAFPNWKAYNQMIGLGGWGGRDETDGPYVYYRDGKVVKDRSEGRGGSHGQQHPFQIFIRDDQHPITRGMPLAWMHVNDELYDRLRGPAENLHVLATAFSDPQTGGTGRHEPMAMTIRFGKGRVFHTPLGHGNDSHQCVGFIALLTRGAEWAATGEVTLELPADFPTSESTSRRDYSAASNAP